MLRLPSVAHRSSLWTTPNLRNCWAAPTIGTPRSGSHSRHHAQRQLLEHPYVKDPDDIHDLLLALGDLSAADILDRTESSRQATLQSMLSDLTRARRIIEIRLAGNPRFIAAEDAARYRDALGQSCPWGCLQLCSNLVSLRCKT